MKQERIAVVCLECRKRFTIAPSNTDPQCSNCNGVDIEVADDVGLRAALEGHARAARILGGLAVTPRKPR